MNAKVTINGLRENDNRICLYIAVSLPLSSPPRTNQRSSQKAQPTPESGVVLVAVDSILHFESLTGVTIQGKKENLSPLSSGIAIFRPAAV